MNEILSFRKLNYNDSDQLGYLLETNNRKEITDYFHPFPMSRDTAQKILDPSKKDLFFVGILDNKFVGLSMLRGFDEGFSIPSFGIFIDFIHQKRGFGHKLTECTLNWSNKNKIKDIRLTVYYDNKIALQLYQSLGFLKTEEYKDGVGRLRYVMHRYLTNMI